MSESFKESDNETMKLSFINTFTEPPEKDWIRQNPERGNSYYIPIGTIENELDITFGAMWEVGECKFDQMPGCVVCTIKLGYKMPDGDWCWRVGVAACPTPLPELGYLQYPALKSEAFKNAAKSIGNRFGRMLNREYVFDSPEIQNDERLEKAKYHANEMLEKLRIDDNEERRLRLKIFNETDPQKVWATIREMQDMLPPNPDPKKQFKKWTI